MPWSSATAVPDPYARPTLLWPSAAVVKAQDELAAFGLDDGPRGPKRSSRRGIWIRNDKPDHGKSAYLLPQLPRSRGATGRSFLPKHCATGWPKTGAHTLYIEPGSPWENGYRESFNSKLRDDFLNGDFFSLKEVKVLTERWRVYYNAERPHSSLGYKPPGPARGRPKLPSSVENWKAKNASRFPTPPTTATGNISLPAGAFENMADALEGEACLVSDMFERESVGSEVNGTLARDEQQLACAHRMRKGPSGLGRAWNSEEIGLIHHKALYGLRVWRYRLSSSLTLGRSYKNFCGNWPVTRYGAGSGGTRSCISCVVARYSPMR
jgi:hypothetical protein